MDSGSSSRDGSMTPRTRARFNVLLEAVKAGEARLVDDSHGRTKIEYKEVKTISLSHEVATKAYTIHKGKNREDLQTRVDVCLKMIKAIKANRAPSGVVLDSSKVKVGVAGYYREGIEFEFLKEVLGKGNMAGDIVVVKDKTTEAEYAVKTVMISQFSEDEVRAWIDLGESDTFPSLYMFRMEGNKIVFHMEKIEHGVTLKEVIEEHMGNLHNDKPELIRPFSLCMFHGLLSAVKEMHDKNWVHGDLHSGNVMLTKDAMKLKILDFGRTHRLKDGEKFDHDALKSDILGLINLFTDLYISNAFDRCDLNKHLKEKTLEKELMTNLNEKDKKELMELIFMTYQVTSNPEQEGYGNIEPVMKRVKDSAIGTDVNMTEVLRTAAGVLFPDFYRGAVDKDLQRGKDVKASGSRKEGDVDVDAAAAKKPLEFIEELSIGIVLFVSPQDPLLATIKRRKLTWFGHVTRHDSLCKTIMQSTVEGGRRRGRQRKNWMGNMKEWTNMTMPELLTAAIDRPTWRRKLASSALMSSQGTELN